MIAAVTEPFPGLRPFTKDESDLFFGRDEQVEELLSRLASRQFLAVVGTSGSGKSSLVRAGLIPILERGHLGPPGSEWVVATVSRPGIDPLHGLARALAEAFALDQSHLPQLEAELSKSSRGLADIARKYLREGQRLFILVDQFEELFRYRKQSGDEGRVKSTAFVKLLLAATGHSELVTLTGEPLVYVVLTMRSDYLGKCAQFRGLPEALNDSQYLVPQMSRDQLREAIEGPVALAGARISDVLVDRLLNDAGDDPDLLPVMQHALFRVWEQSKEARAKGEPVDLAHYSSIGGIKDALNLDADAVFAKFKDDPATQKITRRLFQRLVEQGAQEESRRPTRLSELVRVCREPEREVREVIEAFRGRGFITLSAEDDPLIDISHESLIRQWERLKQWTNEEARSASVYRRLADAAVNQRTLYRGPDLAEALHWEKNDARNPDWAARYNGDPAVFPAAIRFLRRSERRRKAAHAGFALAVAIVFALALTFLVLYRTAELQKERAETQERIASSRQLTVTALLHREDRVDLPSLLAIQSFRIADTFEARNLLLLTNQSDPGFQTYLHHSSEVYAVAFSPDGKTMASASGNGTIQLWDVAKRRALCEPLPGHIKAVTSVAFSPDGKTMASAGVDKTVRLWDVATRRPLGEPLRGHTFAVRSVAFSPDGATLASAGGDETIRLWDVATGRTLGEPLRGHRETVWSVAFSPDGNTLASAGADKTVRLWDVAAHNQLGDPLGGHTSDVQSVAFSRDGTTLASGGWDQTVRLWDVATRRALGDPLRGHSGTVYSVTFSADSKTLATAGEDHTVRLWDVTTRRPVAGPLHGHSGIVSSVAFSPDGKTLASASWDQTVWLWDVTTRPSLAERFGSHSGAVNSVAFSPDGKTLASASDDTTVRLWKVATRQALGDLHGHSKAVDSVVFSPDGKTLASASADTTVRLWDVVTLKALGDPLQGSTSEVCSVAFSPDSKTLASANRDGSVRLWDVGTHKALGEPLQGHTNEVCSVAFSPDGKILALAGRDRVWLWDATKHQPLGELLDVQSSLVFGVAFSPDGKTLASAGRDHTVRLWDVIARSALGEPLRGHSEEVTSVAFSPDGKTLASASADQMVRLWDLPTRQALGAPLQGHSEEVNSVAFSPDGKTLASGSKDKTVWLWDLSLDSWIQRGCARANRNLSLAEWQQYRGKDVPYEKTCPEFPPGDGAPGK